MTEIDRSLSLFERPTRFTLTITDVLGGDTVIEDSNERLACIFGNSEFEPAVTANVTERSLWRVAHTLVILNDLVANLCEEAETDHPDSRRRRNLAASAFKAIVNCAPRGDGEITKGKNGTPFHVAITTAGVEIYTNRLETLQQLRSNGQIAALYEAPKDNPVYDAKEQFRSSKVARIREHPEVLKAVSLDVIPNDDRIGRVVHGDRFGNVELLQYDGPALLAVGETVQVHIRTADGSLYTLPATITSSLKDAPGGKLAVYPEPGGNQHSGGTVYQCVVRVPEGDPSIFKDTAWSKLEALEGFDPATAEVWIEAPTF